MKSVMILAALGAALCMSAPLGVQAAKLTDHDLYCTFIPLTSKCAPAKPAMAAPMAKPAPVVAMAAPMAKPAMAMAKPAAMTVKMYHCEKRTDGKPYLMSCSWK